MLFAYRCASDRMMMHLIIARSVCALLLPHHHPTALRSLFVTTEPLFHMTSIQKYLMCLGMRSLTFWWELVQYDDGIVGDAAALLYWQQQKQKQK